MQVSTRSPGNAGCPGGNRDETQDEGIGSRQDRNDPRAGPRGHGSHGARTGQAPEARGEKARARRPAYSVRARRLASGHDCSNYPYHPTDCWTTPYGPAKADVIIPKPETKTAMTSPNMLYCEGNTYALCFFSGPPTADGQVPSTNTALPCVLSKDGKSANCTCQAYTSGPNFVDINGILNRGAYFETVNVCGTDGGEVQEHRELRAEGRGKNAGECQNTPRLPSASTSRTRARAIPKAR